MYGYRLHVLQSSYCYLITILLAHVRCTYCQQTKGNSKNELVIYDPLGEERYVTKFQQRWK